MEVEWHADKALANRRKHGIDFEEAATCLLDPNALAFEDGSAEGETRWVLVGLSAKPRLLTVIYTVRTEDRIRIISARKATRKEAKSYA